MSRKKTKNTQEKKQDNLIPQVTVKGLTKNQDKYIKNIEKNIVTVCDGPSGSGKTFIAVGLACKYLLEGRIDNILVARSIVGCGKEIGILPGELDQKIHPYMMPTIDYFNHFLKSPSTVNSMIRNGKIKLMPVELLRGHTYKDSMMILEEAQNCTPRQLKLFMSRIGENSKMVISGDVDQSDEKDNGMEFLLENFHEGIENFGIAELDYGDIVRHPIIGRILKVFDDKGVS